MLISQSVVLLQASFEYGLGEIDTSCFRLDGPCIGRVVRAVARSDGVTSGQIHVTASIVTGLRKSWGKSEAQPASEIC